LAAAENGLKGLKAGELYGLKAFAPAAAAGHQEAKWLASSCEYKAAGLNSELRCWLRAPKAAAAANGLLPKGLEDALVLLAAAAAAPNPNRLFMLNGCDGDGFSSIVFWIISVFSSLRSSELRFSSSAAPSSLYTFISSE